LAAHTSGVPGHRIALDHLGLRPLLFFGMRLGEGSGAALAVTVLAAAGLLMWPEDEVAAPAAATAVAPSAPTPPPTVVTAPTPAVVTPPTPTVAAATPTPPAPTEAEGAPSPPVPPESQGATEGAAEEVVVASLQRQAVDHYIAGRLTEALAIYRQLAASEPANPAYASMVRILERRTRCRDGVGPGGAPCGEP
jgi:hypothetical protein